MRIANPEDQLQSINVDETVTIEVADLKRTWHYSSLTFPTIPLVSLMDFIHLITRLVRRRHGYPKQERSRCHCQGMGTYLS